MNRPTLIVSLAGLAALAGASDVPAQHVEHLDSLRAWHGLPPITVGAAGFADRGWARRAEAAAASRSPLTGVLTVMLVPALFADSDAPSTPADHVQQLFFGDPGLLTAFFDEASGGGLTATGEAAPWFRTSVTHQDGTGGETSVLGIGPAFGDYLLDALAAADEVLDFRAFDNDGPDGIPDSGDDDGQVDALAFMFAEVARSCGGTGVWPHKSGLAGYNGGEPWASADLGVSGEPIVANGYIIISGSQCDGTPISNVGVVAHELGHEIRLPDLYHPIGSGVDRILPENRRWVLGCFDLMAAGSWGCGPAIEFPSFGPTHFSPWTRDRLGWIELDTVTDVRYQEFSLTPVRSERRGLEIPLDADGRESLLVEYRAAAGFDADLPASGVLIYRYDRDAAFKPDPGAPRHYQIGLLEADDDSALVRTHAEGGNRGAAADFFATEGTIATLSNVTRPSTRRADGTRTTVTIHSIAIDGGIARLVISTAATPEVAAGVSLDPVAAASPMSRVVPVGGGAQPYAVALEPGTHPSGLTARIEADRLTIEGTPLEAGGFDIQVRLTDTLGTTAVSGFQLDVAHIAFADANLIAALVQGGGSLGALERQLLDNEGNGNGRLDVGDVRAYLRQVRPLTSIAR